ncbi:DNA-binding transcriptional regulator, MarR family [Nocardioides terrae]|uniref:DNA-binding transcriptional regulator, MarR family n=1 Tax=Nocardioides terrae TaxID=574651 RepID=A0A1I1D7G9_9ACTN|nr:transcriptional regulator [Nocardioides terrae]SFB70754.1 DNA-binding transcriptional regulator, MarR family [Nocardioides terrae]
MSETPSALDGLDPALTAPKRLAAMALLSRSAGADFAALRAHLGVSESDLSKQMAALVAAGYVTVRKSGRGRGSATTYQATRGGSRAYARHRAALEAILDGAPAD